MDKRTKSLFTSLVGGSIDFSFKKKANDALSIEQNIAVEKRRIARNVQLAFSVENELCITLLGEMYSFYSKELYFMAVRGSIELRRYRPIVLNYLKNSTEDRANHLLDLVKDRDYRKDLNSRESIVEALRYFLSTYKGRLRDFKGLLTKEEFLLVA